MGDQNPWVVESIEAFSFYCCPECDFKSKVGDHFKRHAMESHNKSKVFFIDLMPENKYLLEFETEPKDEYDEGMEKFGASEMIVKEESLSESNREVNKNKAQTLKNGPDLELFDDYEPAENNLKTIDSPKAEENVEELKNFDGENYQDFTKVEISDDETIDNSRQVEMTDKELEQDLNIINEMESETKVEPAQTFDENIFSITEEKNNIIRGEKKRKRDSDIEREKKKKKMRAILDMDDNDEEDPFEMENSKIQDPFGNDPGSDPDFNVDIESDQEFNIKRKKFTFDFKLERIEEAKRTSYAEVGRSYGIEPSIISRWTKIEDKLRQAVGKGSKFRLTGGGMKGRKRYDLVDQSLYEWYSQQITRSNAKITGSMLRKKAQKLANGCASGSECSKFSYSWLEGFKKKYGIPFALNKRSNKKHDPVEIENLKIQDPLENDLVSDQDFVAKSYFDSEIEEESDQASYTKISKLSPYSKIQKTEVNTPKSDKNYLTLKGKHEMRAILEKEVTEERDPVEIENQKSQDCLGDGDDPDFVANSGNESNTDELSDQLLNKKCKKIDQSIPQAYLSTPKSAKNYLTLEEKLKMRAILGKEDTEDEENPVEIENKKNLDYLGDPLATLSDPSQHNTVLVSRRTRQSRSMEKMESLLSLWVQDLDQRGIIVASKQIQTKAKSLYLQVKEKFQNKTEAEIKETFMASNTWLHLFRKRHNKNILKVCGKAKSANNYAANPSGLKRYIKTVHEKKKEHKCEMCHETFSLKNVLTNHIKIVHEGQRSFSKKQNLNNQRKEVDMKIKTFKCKDCNKSFSSKKNVESHERLVHGVIKPSQRYTCNECKTSYEEKELIESHINSVHLNKRPYKCNLCEESFFIDSELKQHLKRTHRICGEKISLFE